MGNPNIITIDTGLKEVDKNICQRIAKIDEWERPPGQSGRCEVIGMGKYVYGAIVRPSEDGGYWAEVPDLPGCFAQGKDYMDTIEGISDSIETHLAALAEYGMATPQAGVVVANDGDVVYVYADTDDVKLGVPGFGQCHSGWQSNLWLRSGRQTRAGLLLAISSFLI